MKYEVEKYYVWKNNDHADTDGFWNYDEAYKYAKSIEADEIEKTCWKTDKAYENGEPADNFITVWKKEMENKI